MRKTDDNKILCSKRLNPLRMSIAFSTHGHEYAITSRRRVAPHHLLPPHCEKWLDLVCKNVLFVEMNMVAK